jgi:predicted phage terminase large subunit-like protein
MVKKDWLKFFSHRPKRENATITQSWDTALKGNAANDYSVCTTWLQRNGQHYLIDVFRQQLDFPDLIKAVDAQLGKHSPDALLIEDQGSGISLIQILRCQYGIDPIGVRSTDDKETRLSIVLPMFEAGAVFLPEDEPWLPDLLRELFGFPQTRHDDQVDSITQYLTWARNRSSAVFEADFGHDDIPRAEEIGYHMILLGSGRM